MTAVGVVVAVLALGAAQDRAEADAFLHRGVAAYRTGDFPTAIREFEASYRLFPGPHSLFNLARAYDKVDRKQDALAAYERFLSAFAEASPEVRVALAPREVTVKARADQLRRELTPSAPASAPAPALGRESRPAPANLLIPARVPPPARMASARRWWLVAAGTLAVGAATTYLVVRARRNPCPAEFDGCL